MTNTRIKPGRICFLQSLLACCSVLSSGSASAALCNGGTAVSSALTISVSCAGAGSSPLKLDSGASVTINSGVTVSNTAGSGRNGDPVTILSTATASSLINNGTISTAAQWAVTVNGTLTSLINSGTISSGVRRGVTTNGGSIGTLTNTGSITGPFGGVTASNGAIQTFNNLQGAGNGNGAVTYAGTLPGNYNIIINSPTTYGKLSNAGASGATTFGVYSTSVVAAGSYATVLSGFAANNLTATSGQFGWFNWTLSPNAGTPTNWDLTFSRRSVAAATTTQGNTTAGGAAGVLDRIVSGETPSSAGMTAVVNRLAQLATPADVDRAVTQTLPLMTGGITQATSGVLHGINGVVQARQESNRGLSSGDDFAGDRKFWLRPFGSRAQQNDVGSVAGFKANTAGFALGFDGSTSSTHRLGLGFAYGNTDVNGSSQTARQSALVDTYQAILYGSYSLDERTEINYQVDGGMNINKGSRSIAFMNLVADSSYKTRTAHAGVAISRLMPVSGQTSFMPSLRADYTWMRDQAYVESGAGALNLNVGQRDVDEFIVGGDAKLLHQLSDRLALTGNIGAGYDVSSKAGSVTASYVGGGPAFSTVGLTPSKWVYRGGLGMVVALASGAEMTARYDLERRGGFDNQTASLKLRWVF